MAETPRDRARDARRQIRLNRRSSTDSLTPQEESGIPYSVSPMGALISDARHAVRDYRDNIDVQATMDNARKLAAMAPEERTRPLKNI